MKGIRGKKQSRKARLEMEGQRMKERERKKKDRYKTDEE